VLSNLVNVRKITRWLREHVSWLLGAIVAGIVSNLVRYYLDPYLGVVGSVLMYAVLWVSFLPLFFLLMDAAQYLGQHKMIKFLNNEYVLPWHRYFAVKILLAIRETLNSDLSKAKQHLLDVARFLEETETTRYLRKILTAPTPGSLTGRETFAILNHVLGRTWLDDLPDKINALRNISYGLAPGREREASQHIENISKSIVDYEKIKQTLAKELGMRETSDEVLMFGVDPQRYQGLVAGVRSPWNSEVDIWASLIPEKHQEVTQKELKKKALPAIIMSDFIFVIPILVTMAMYSTFVVLLGMLLPSAPSVSPAIIVIAVLAIVLAIYGRILVPQIIKEIRGYLSLNQTPGDHLIYTLPDLQLSSLQILRDGLKTSHLKNVDFCGKNVDLSNFVYRCACAFLPRQYPRAKSIVFRHNPHVIEVNLEEFFHAKANVGPCLLPRESVCRQEISQKELEELSLMVVRSCESERQGGIVSEDIQCTLAWAYANALRVTQFENIEMARVGMLPSYRAPRRPGIRILSRIPSW